MHVSVFRHVKFKAWMLTSFFENFFDAKRLILWTVNILHVLTLDTTLNLDTNDETYNLRLPVTRSFKK